MNEFFYRSFQKKKEFIRATYYITLLFFIRIFIIHKWLHNIATREFMLVNFVPTETIRYAETFRLGFQ